MPASMVAVADIPAVAAPSWSALTIERLPPGDGLPALAQAFAVPLGDGATGLAWVGFGDAMSVGGFGRAWVGAALGDLAEMRGAEPVLSALAAPGGLRIEVS